MASKAKKTEQAAQGPISLTRAEVLTLCSPEGTRQQMDLVDRLPAPDGKRGTANLWSLTRLSQFFHALVWPEGGEDMEQLKADKLKAEIRVRKLQGDAKKLDLDVAKKKLVPVSEVFDYGKALGVSVRTQLESIPASMAVRLSQVSDPREVESLLEERIDGVLQGLEAWTWDKSAWRQRSADQSGAEVDAADAGDNNEEETDND